MTWDKRMEFFSLFFNLFYINVVPAFPVFHIFHKFGFFFPFFNILAFKIVLVSMQLITWTTSHSVSFAMEFFLVNV